MILSHAGCELLELNIFTSDNWNNSSDQIKIGVKCFKTAAGLK